MRPRQRSPRMVDIIRREEDIRRPAASMRPRQRSPRMHLTGGIKDIHHVTLQ